MARLMGRSGWHGQCSCCNGPRTRDSIRRYETAQWLRDYRDDLDSGWNEVMAEALWEQKENVNRGSAPVRPTRDNQRLQAP